MKIVILSWCNNKQESNICKFSNRRISIKKSIPSICVNLLATSVTLYLSILPSALYLILYTHLQSMGVLSTGRSVRVQVQFWCKACNSESMALNPIVMFNGLFILGSSLIEIESVKWKCDRESFEYDKTVDKGYKHDALSIWDADIKLQR